MSDRYFWGSNDAKTGRCTYAVVGTERRDDPADNLGVTWIADDAIAGRCLASEVGRPRNPPAELLPDQIPAPEVDEPEPEPVEPEPEAPMSDDIFENELAAYKADPARYRSSNASNLNKLLEMTARRQEKALEAPQRLALDQLTDADFRRMSLTELMRTLVQVVMQHVPEDRHEAALRCLQRPTRTS